MVFQEAGVTHWTPTNTVKAGFELASYSAQTKNNAEQRATFGD